MLDVINDICSILHDNRIDILAVFCLNHSGVFTSSTGDLINETPHDQSLIFSPLCVAQSPR